MSAASRVCPEFESWLDRLEDGADDAPDAGHLGTCPVCCDHVARVLGAAASSARVGSENLTRAILARTSGAACRRARPLLCDLADGTLAGPERELVRMHRDGCAECRALSGSLGELRGDLAALADVDPGAGFTASVLALTAGRRREQYARGRWRSFAARLVARPRLAWEVAYGLTVVLVASAGPPALPRVDAAPRVFASLAPHARALVEVVPTASAELAGRADAFGRQAVSAAAARTADFRGTLTEMDGETLRRLFGRLWLFFTGGSPERQTDDRTFEARRAYW